MNLLARIFRASGRILLAIGSILAIGFAVLAIPTSNNDTTTPIQPESTPPTSSESAIIIDDSNRFVALIISIALSALILFAFYKCLRHYNNSIRKAIAKLAKAIKHSIYTTELGLTTILWAIATVLAYIFSPYIAITLLFAMIANILCFVFAWLAYAQPEYRL